MASSHQGRICVTTPESNRRRACQVVLFDLTLHPGNIQQEYRERERERHRRHTTEIVVDVECPLPISCASEEDVHGDEAPVIDTFQQRTVICRGAAEVGHAEDRKRALRPLPFA